MTEYHSPDDDGPRASEPPPLVYGLFNHDIPLNIEDRISIIHAPNGFGKTVILKFISGFFGGSMNVFREVEFKKVIFELLDGQLITITQREPERPRAA